MESVALIRSFVRLTKTNDLQASDGILKIGHLLRSNEFKRAFNRNSFQISL